MYEQYSRRIGPMPLRTIQRRRRSMVRGEEGTICLCAECCQASPARAEAREKQLGRVRTMLANTYL